MKRYIKSSKSDYSDAPYIDINKTYYLVAAFTDETCETCIATVRRQDYADAVSDVNEGKGDGLYYKIYKIRPEDDEPELNPLYG